MILPCNLESVDVIEETTRHEPVVIPTDTLYGLAMSIYGDVSLIYSLKGRDLNKRIPVGVSDVEMMKNIAFVDEIAMKIVGSFLPGGVTLVLRSKIPEITGPTVGVRIPAHPIPIELARRVGPITLTSANISGERNPVRIEDTMGLKVKYRIDCGILPGTPSTVIEVIDGIKLIREGVIPFSAILNVLED